MERTRAQYAVIDVETTRIADGEIPKTLFWGYADEAGYSRFNTTKELLRFLKGRKEHILLHHANYDILQLLIDGTRNLQILRSHNGRLIRCKLGKHTTINTYSCFPVKLEKIFKAFGYNKTSLDNLEKRNYEDCVNGLDALLRLDSIFYSLCHVSPLQRGTIAGTAFQAAELSLGRKMPEDNQLLEAYRGGRVEVFDTRLYCSDTKWSSLLYSVEKRDKDLVEEWRAINRIPQDCSKFDINSSYPKSILDCPKEGELWKIEVWTKDWHCPFFDVVNEDMLCFPNGHFYSYVYRDVFEKYIEPVMEHTKIKVIKRNHIDLNWLYDLKGFIGQLYELKQNTKEEGIRECCKLLLNSFYGRIGLKGESERCRILDYRPDKEGTFFKIGRSLWLCFDTVYREAKSNFPFAAYITDNARARLFNSFKKLSPIYGDTDSCITSNENSSLTIGSQCGEWKDETKEEFKTTYLREPINGEEKEPTIAINVKDYLFGKKEVRKGGSSYLKWTLKQFAAGKSAEKVNRSRITELRKRIVNPDGTTEPLQVSYYS